MKRILLFSFIFNLFVSASYASLQHVFPITDFSKEELVLGELIGWKSHKGLCRKIRYNTMPTIMEKDEKLSIYVNANDSGSIAFKSVDLDPKKYSYLNWNWKVSNIIPKSREKEIGGDDYPAAVCIVFGKTLFGIPYKYKILIYVFANNVSVGERFTNPCEKDAKMIVVQSGSDGVGQWLNYKVNHYQDFLEEFGQEPQEIIYVGIQTNADRTHGTVEAWYTDIFLSTE